MQGAGNDFVVLDETQGRLGLSAAQYRFLADRHFGVGADQILDCAGVWFDMPPDIAHARGHLMALRGRAHVLAAAGCGRRAPSPTDCGTSNKAP